MIRVRIASVVAAIAAALPAQSEVVVYDAPAGHNLAYDAARQRLARFGLRGDVSEFDGVSWRRRPVDPAMVMSPIQPSFQVVYDESRRQCIRIGPGNSVAGYDGAAWHALPSTVTLPGAAVYDPARRAVLYIGWNQLQLETWALRGSVWTLIGAQSQVAPARLGFGLAADRARGRVVLFGGVILAGSYLIYRNDTLEWDGTSWTAQSPTQSPSPRVPRGMVYDSVRERIVMYGGSALNAISSEVHEYDGVTWNQPAFSNGWPGPTRVDRVAFDEQRGEMVLLQHTGAMRSWNGARWLTVAPPAPPFEAASVAAFPGADGTSIYTFGGVSLVPVAHAQTWHWNGARWIDRSTPGPAARMSPAVCASATDGYMFGGSDFGAAFADFWRWDGTVWHAIPGAGPSARLVTTMTYDPVRSEVVLFGGNGNPLVGGIPGPALDDTWVYDGTAWQQRQPTTRPSPRWAHGMTFDHTTGVVILGGGVDGTLNPVTGTWQWNGTNWNQLSSVGPNGRGSMAYDVQRGSPLWWNGTEVAQWNGAGWGIIAQTPTEPTVSRHHLCGWPYSKGVILVSEVSSADPSTCLISLSTLNPSAAPYGSGCGPRPPVLAANGWPRIDDPAFGIEVSSAPSNALVALIGALQTASQPLGGCTVLVQPGQLALLLAGSPAGFAAAPLPLPNDVGLLGLDIYFQAAALDPTAAAGFTMSPGLRATLGN